MIRGRRAGRPSACLIAAAATLCLAAAAGPGAAAGRTHRILMKDVAFAPAKIAIRVGDTLQWDNRDVVAHTATSKEGGFDVNVAPGRKGSAVAKRPGTFSYICRYHPNMTGEVIVEP